MLAKPGQKVKALFERGEVFILTVDSVSPFNFLGKQTYIYTFKEKDIANWCLASYCEVCE